MVADRSAAESRRPIASVASPIISPAWRATAVAPRIRPLFASTWIRAKPSDSPSRMARSTSENGTVNVRTASPAAAAEVAEIPTCAISGSV